MATATASKAQTLKGLVEGTQGLYHSTHRDDYGRTVNEYSMVLDGRRDYLVVVNLPKSWTEKYDTKYMVNTAPARYNEGEVLNFANRTDAHLFAVKTLVARFEAEGK